MGLSEEGGEEEALPPSFYVPTPKSTPLIPGTGTGTPQSSMYQSPAPPTPIQTMYVRKAPERVDADGDEEDISYDQSRAYQQKKSVVDISYSEYCVESIYQQPETQAASNFVRTFTGRDDGRDSVYTQASAQPVSSAGYGKHLSLYTLNANDANDDASAQRKETIAAGIARGNMSTYLQRDAPNDTQHPDWKDYVSMNSSPSQSSYAIEEDEVSQAPGGG